MKALLKKYETKEIESSYILNILNISRRRFFKILKNYREDKNNFSIDYKRVNSNNKIDKEVEANILNTPIFKYARFADDMIILVSGYYKWEWLLKAAYKRLIQEF